MARNVKLLWLENDEHRATGEPDRAHLCAVNDEETKAAAVCGYASMYKWRRSSADNTTCEKCLAIDKSGVQINFAMPNGTTVTVRERQQPRQ